MAITPLRVLRLLNAVSKPPPPLADEGEPFALLKIPAPQLAGTQPVAHHLLNDGRALTLEGYEFPDGTGALSVTGGIGGFFGASGDVQFPPGVTLGTNVTGCPNFRAKFRIRRGAN